MSKNGMKKQPTFHGCFVCGKGNPFGLQVEFHADGDKVYTEFRAEERHVGWPGFLHGGILYSLLDETVGRAAMMRDMWVMTGRMEVRYYNPVPIGERLTITGEVVKERRTAMELKGEARLSDGRLAAQANGLFMKVSDEMRRDVEKVLTWD
jgi:uncharacterized protein (TIGR00369 family)